MPLGNSFGQAAAPAPSPPPEELAPWLAPWYGQSALPPPTPPQQMYQREPDWRPPQFSGILQGEPDFKGSSTPPQLPFPTNPQPFVDAVRPGRGAPMGFYPPQRPLTPSEIAAYHQSVNWGIDPRWLYQVPVDVRELGGATGGYFDLGQNRVALDTKNAQIHNGQPLFHEQSHALQFNMTPEEQARLGELMKANPPPMGAPLLHHPEPYYRLPTYFDYMPFDGSTGVSNEGLGAGWTPDAEMFRSTVGKPWMTPPTPILDFIRQRYPLPADPWTPPDVQSPVGSRVGDVLQQPMQPAARMQPAVPPPPPPTQAWLAPWYGQGLAAGQ